ncbi:hypothetical protein WICPIJ_009524 [Wickerhamomyces pijperi]|uniref:Uncharacterized protein n=1 Tax=Wickerhamomyces pijperi TaxID=599730 RepID=A0A9P8TCY6_WICPI|nr:hypothetical protein WICPIJ_009524 [Wickerhamomyces pijperi]
MSDRRGLIDGLCRALEIPEELVEQFIGRVRMVCIGVRHELGISTMVTTGSLNVRDTVVEIGVVSRGVTDVGRGVEIGSVGIDIGRVIIVIVTVVLGIVESRSILWVCRRRGFIGVRARRIVPAVIGILRLVKVEERPV